MNYLFMFLEGIVSFISPCLLPMLPIYFSYLAGSKKEGMIKNTIGFVCGFSFTFIMLGIFSSTIGILVKQYMDILQIMFGIITIVFGLNYMEILSIHFLNRTSQLQMHFNNFNFLKSMIFGILFSITWTPCVGAFLGTALMMVAKERTSFKRNIYANIVFIRTRNTIYFVSIVIRKNQ